jgi:phosphate transport system substrate-binding protein
MNLNRRAVFGSITAGALALSLAACGGNDSNGGNDGDNDMGGLSGELTASGASFPDAYYQAAIDAFADVSPDIIITYNAVGSGTGKSEFGEGLTDFAGTDSLVKEEEGLEPGSYQYIPTVAAPITVSYNLPGVDGLQLGQETLAQIFQGDITSWDDDAIAADNPDADLPSTEITIAHRADGSGTTSNFSKFLDQATESWTLGSGDTIEWPSNSLAGEKNTGVAQIIQETEGAVGYVDLADAEASGLVFAAIENLDGEFVIPSLDGTTAGLDGAEVADDLSYNPLNAAGAEAYPITAPTFLLIRTDYDAETGALVKAFLTWLLTDGQDLAAENQFAPLPEGLRQQALDAINETIA